MNNRQLDIFNQDDFNLFWTVIDAYPNNEGIELEYKSAKGGFPHDFWKTYSAFANSMGGHIVLGVQEKSGKVQVEGLEEEQISKYKKIFWDNANNRSTVSQSLLQEDDLKIIEFAGKMLLVFKIPAALRTQKPLHLTKNPFDNTYKRNHEGDYRCTNEEVRRMLADADNKLHQDSRILEGFSLEDVDLASLKKYRQLFASTKPSHPWLILDDRDFLEKLGGYRKDRVSKKEGLTVAALLMFGKSESITDLECIPGFFPDFREILSNDEDTRWTDRIYPDGTWEANLLNFYLKVWPKLSSSLPKPFQLKEGIRKDETPAHVALRESFVNVLIHTDYTAPGNIVIEHTKENFIFSNPGTLLVSLPQYYHGGISECRNPNLQKMFLMIGSAEKAGSGVNKIMAGWEYAHWRRPYLRIENQPDRLVLDLPMFSIIPEDTFDSIKKLFGNQVDTLGKNELTILASCQIEGEITNNRLQYLLDLHRTDITGLLQELCRAGYLISENKGRWTTYHLNENFEPQKIGIFSANKVDTSDVKVDTSDEVKVDTSEVKVDTSDGVKVDTSEVGFSDLKHNELIKKTKSNQPKTRIKKPELFHLILNSCADEFKTLEEIAIEVGKESKYLKNKVFPELIKENKIERLYPTLNHPNQAYKVKNNNE